MSCRDGGVGVEGEGAEDHLRLFEGL